MSNLAGDLELAERTARAAGALLIERHQRPVQGLGSKSSRTDMVSDADRDAEALIASELAVSRPDDGLLGEEGTTAAGESGRRWVIDPLDGTTNYLYRHPNWVVSIGLEDDDGGLVGVVHDPIREETFTAIRGEGAYLNGESIAVSGAELLDQALVATGFGYAPARRAAQAGVLLRVLPRVRDIRRGGSAALDFCSVACGRLDAYYERGVNPWDWSAGRLIASEAGAAILELLGEPYGLIASAPAIADELHALVR